MKGDDKGSDNGPAWTAHRMQPVRPRAAVRLIAVLVALALSLSACEPGRSSSGVAYVGSSSTTTTQSKSSSSSLGSSGSTTTTQPKSSQGSSGSSGSPLPLELEFAQCMRSNGVPSFPDPSTSGGFELTPGSGPSSPAFKLAQAKCQKFLPAGPGSGAPPTTQALAQMLKVSQCMRRHGISAFPDPRTSVPPISGGIDIADRDGVILVFPRGFDEQSPQFMKAAAACGFKLTNH